MSGRQRRSARDNRRRSLQQNFLVDQDLIDRFVGRLDIADGELVVDIGAGAGSLTIPLARAGAQVWAVEKDPLLTAKLEVMAQRLGLRNSIRILNLDFRQFRLPKTAYRVVANPPFAHTTTLLEHLLNQPDAGPTRADLVLERGVVTKHASIPPVALRTAAWSPWWQFSRGLEFPRSAFRPVPSVDARVLRIDRRNQDVLPTWLAPALIELLRPGWQPPPVSTQRRRTD